MLSMLTHGYKNTDRTNSHLRTRSVVVSRIHIVRSHLVLCLLVRVMYPQSVGGGAVQVE